MDSTFIATPDRKKRYHDALSYWPGKFSEHAVIADHIHNNRHKSVIDSGGTGSFSPFLAGIQLTLANPKHGGIDGAELPFKNASFDCGVSTHTLEHVALSRRTKFLHELLRVSRYDVYIICPLGNENKSIDSAKTKFVGNTHMHDQMPRVTQKWLKPKLQQPGWTVKVRGILNRFVHFSLAMLLPVNTSKKRRICRWINERYDVTPPLGDPYSVFIHFKKK